MRYFCAIVIICIFFLQFSNTLAFNKTLARLLLAKTVKNIRNEKNIDPKALKKFLQNTGITNNNFPEKPQLTPKDISYIESLNHNINNKN